MNIQSITSGIKPAKFQEVQNEGNGVGFGNLLTDFVKQVNQNQIESNQALNDFVSGNGVELHEVMIAGEKAKTSLELLVEIRNKALDMYREINRM